MSDYISRADAIEAVRGLSVLVDDEDFSYFEDALKALPSADAVSREWYDDAVKANHELAFTDLPDIPRYYYEKVVGKMAHEINMLKEQLESADAELKMTEEVREALMRLTMCAREECAMCKYKDECGYDFQYKISTDNMNTLSDALLRSRCEVDARSADAVQGEWIEKYNGNGWNDFWDYTCSNCGKKYERADAVLYHANYCPNCGARMKGGEDE